MEINREALWEKVDYHPHPKQLLFHDSKARFKVPVCGRRFGKSMMAAMELMPYLFDLDIKGARFWIVGPTYDLGEKEFRYLWDMVVVKLGLGPRIKRKAYNVRTGEMFIEMPWGTRVDVKSADHPDGLVGEGLSGVILSEAAKQKQVVWDKYIRPALADKHGWAIFPSTPEGFNWYYTDAYRRGLDDDYPEYESWNFPSWENPHVYPLGFEDPEIQSQMHGEGDAEFWQEIGADFKSFVGKIYTDWSDEVHIMQGEYEYHPEWHNYLFFDFGFANPFVALDVQVDPSDTIYIWREHYKAEVQIHQHIQMLQARSNPKGYAVRCGFGDYADKEAVATLSEHFVPTYADTDSKDVIQGIQWVKKFLRVDETPEGKKTKLYVHKSCENTIFEFQNYRMITSRMDKGDRNPKEEPKKFNDHAMDAIRYGIMHLFVLGARYHLADVRGEPNTEPLSTERAPAADELVGAGSRFGSKGNGSFFKLDEGDTFSMGKTRW